MTTHKNVRMEMEDFDIELTLGRRQESEEGSFYLGCGPLFHSFKLLKPNLKKPTFWRKRHESFFFCKNCSLTSFAFFALVGYKLKNSSSQMQIVNQKNNMKIQTNVLFWDLSEKKEIKACSRISRMNVQFEKKFLHWFCYCWTKKR